VYRHVNVGMLIHFRMCWVCPMIVLSQLEHHNYTIKGTSTRSG